MPTVTKKMPSSRPLNGSRSTSIWWRYSLSPSRMPARKAPSATDNPRCAGGRRNPDHDDKRDRHDEFAAAGARGRAHHRRDHVFADHHDEDDDGERLRERRQQIEQRFAAPPWRSLRMPTMNRIGTTIRSWNSSTDSAMRPTGAAARCWSIRSCITIAVDDSARQSPSTMPGGRRDAAPAHDHADGERRRRPPAASPTPST